MQWVIFVVECLLQIDCHLLFQSERVKPVELWDLASEYFAELVDFKVAFGE